MTPGWILGVICFSAAVIGLYFLNRGAGTRFGLCPFRFVTDLPCFLCGGTTASIQLASGAPAAALGSNPLVVITLCLFSLWSFLWLAFGIRADFTLPRSLIVALIALGVVLNWAYLIHRWDNRPGKDTGGGMFPSPPRVPDLNQADPTQRSN